MKLILLVEPKMLPIPEGITVLDNYGFESITYQPEGKRGVVTGDSMLVEGEQDIIADWLRPFDGVWTSKCPATGQWEVGHIK